MPLIRRQTARVLPVDDEGRVLLLHGWDPHHPDQPFWARGGRPRTVSAGNSRGTAAGSVEISGGDACATS
jgi:hypothetical protein